MRQFCLIAAWLAVVCVRAAQPPIYLHGSHGLPPANLHPDAESHVTVSLDSADKVSVYQICTLCCLMYGAIAGLWFIYSRLPKERTGTFYTLLLCITWASTSVGMHVLNKSLATKLKSPELITIVQMAIAVLLVGGMSYRRLLEADRRQVRVWLIVPLFFASMLCTSISSYEYISLSLLTVVRNLMPLVVLPIEFLLMPAEKRPQISAMVVGSMSISLIGAIIYAGGVEFSRVGIAFAFVNMCLAASDRLIQRRLLTTECKDLQSSVCTTINNALGIVPTLLVAFFTHELSDATTPEKKEMWTDPAVWFLLVLSGAVGIGICYLGFECQRVITATSFFVLQNMSKVFVVMAGIFVFHDTMGSPLHVLGLALSLGGSFLYGKAQIDLEVARPASIAQPAKLQSKEVDAEQQDERASDCSTDVTDEGSASASSAGESRSAKAETGGQGLPT